MIQSIIGKQGWAPCSPVQPEPDIRKIRAVFSGSTGEFPGGSGSKAPVFPGSTGKYAGGSGRLVRFSLVVRFNRRTGCPALLVNPTGLRISLHIQSRRLNRCNVNRYVLRFFETNFDNCQLKTLVNSKIFKS